MDKKQKAQEGALRNATGQKVGENIFMSEAGAGIKLPPKTVLVMSLLFIGCVVVLHFFDKIKL